MSSTAKLSRKGFTKKCPKGLSVVKAPPRGSAHLARAQPTFDMLLDLGTARNVRPIGWAVLIAVPIAAISMDSYVVALQLTTVANVMTESRSPWRFAQEAWSRSHLL
jgi:hypothetical protein